MILFAYVAPPLHYNDIWAAMQLKSQVYSLFDLLVDKVPQKKVCKLPTTVPLHSADTHSMHSPHSSGTVMRTGTPWSALSCLIQTVVWSVLQVWPTWAPSVETIVTPSSRTRALSPGVRPPTNSATGTWELTQKEVHRLGFPQYIFWDVNAKNNTSTKIQ